MKRRILVVLAFAAATCAWAETITVATVDVWSGLTYRGVFRSGEYEDRATRAFRFDLLSRGLGSLVPDIIALQEANPLPRYADEVASELDYDAVYDVRQAGVRIGPVGLPANLREGSVILAGKEFALTQLPTTNLSGSGAGNVASFQFGQASQLVGGQIEVEGRAVYVYTTRWTPSPHSDRDRLVELVDAYDDGDLDGDGLVNLIDDAVTGSARRREEARRTLVTINEVAGEAPVVLMGSFHALPDSPEIELLREAGFVDVWASVGRGAGYTYDATVNSNIALQGSVAGEPVRERIDYIFIRGDGIVARSAAVVFARPTYGVFVSDHFGLMAELRIDAVR